MLPSAALQLEWRVEECATGEELYARIAEHGERYDIVFVDEHYEVRGDDTRTPPNLPLNTQTPKLPVVDIWI